MIGRLSASMNMLGILTTSFTGQPSLRESPKIHGGINEEVIHLNIQNAVGVSEVLPI